MKTFKEFFNENEEMERKSVERKSAFRRSVSRIFTPWGEEVRDPRIKFRVIPRKPKKPIKDLDLSKD